MNIYTNINIPYTLAFCTVGNKVLLLRRNKPPNVNLWNGLGGKIEAGETPHQNIKRELFEEAGLNITIQEEDYKGIVTWNTFDKHKIGGTHLYVFSLASISDINCGGNTDEGLLEWKDKKWAFNSTNSEIVDNIPFFLPIAMTTTQPQIYECLYNTRNELISFHSNKMLDR